MEYKSLWVIWANCNPALMIELKELAKANNNTLSDMFGTTPITQARALCDILNNL